MQKYYSNNLRQVRFCEHMIIRFNLSENFFPDLILNELRITEQNRQVSSNPWTLLRDKRELFTYDSFTGNNLKVKMRLCIVSNLDKTFKTYLNTHQKDGRKLTFKPKKPFRSISLDLRVISCLFWDTYY